MDFVQWRNLRFCLTGRTLHRDGIAVELSDIESAALKLLIDANGELVSTETLLRELWPGKSVSNSSLTLLIHKLRRAVHPDGDLVVVNVPREGYRTGVVWAHPGEPHVQQTHEPRISRRTLVAGAGATALAGLAFGISKRFEQESHHLRVRQYVPLTRDGIPKSGPAVSDGRRIYYTETGERSRVVGIPITGGEPVPLWLPNLDPITEIRHLSSDLKTVVLVTRSKRGSSGWIWRVGANQVSPLSLPVDNITAWDSRGPKAVTVTDRTLSIALPGKDVRAFAMPGLIGSVMWLPDGSRLRIMITASEKRTVWDVPIDRGQPTEVRGADGKPATDLGDGTWTRDGRYFIFRNYSSGQQDLKWVRETNSSIVSAPENLTKGGLSWSGVTASPDGRTLYAVGSRTRDEMVQIDAAGQSYRPFLKGISATEVDFSRDGRWITYTRIPDNTIWIAKSDGTDLRQLTTTDFASHMAHFSPDGRSVAFMNQRTNGPWQICIVPSDGSGKPEPIAPSLERQGVPTWSADGRHIVYGEALDPSRRAGMRLRVIDTKRRTIEAWPDSEGLWTARWSPDGRFIAALTTDSKAVVILDVARKTRKEIARFHYISNPMWSANSAWIYSEVDELPQGKAMYRVHFDGARVERIAELAGFTSPPDRWFGVTPNGTIIGARSVTVSDIYALECEFP